MPVLPAVLSRLIEVNLVTPQALVAAPVKAADGIPDPAVMIVAGVHSIGVGMGISIDLGQVDKAPFGIGPVEAVTFQVRYENRCPGKAEGDGTVIPGFLQAQV